MSSETDQQFVERISLDLDLSNTADIQRLFALARRGAAVDEHAVGFREGAAHMHKAQADRIAQLEAEVKTWQGHAKTAIWGDSEECKSLSAEVDRLVRSRNKWGQRYNKLLLKIRAGESGETDDPASWQLRMALDDANVKNDEAADRIEQLEAALKMFACDCTITGRCAVPDNCPNFQARRIVEERA